MGEKVYFAYSSRLHSIVTGNSKEEFEELWCIVKSRGEQLCIPTRAQPISTLRQYRTEQFQGIVLCQWASLSISVSVAKTTTCKHACRPTLSGQFLIVIVFPEDWRMHKADNLNFIGECNGPPDVLPKEFIKCIIEKKHLINLCFYLTTDSKQL